MGSNGARRGNHGHSLPARTTPVPHAFGDECYYDMRTCAYGGPHGKRSTANKGLPFLPEVKCRRKYGRSIADSLVIGCTQAQPGACAKGSYMCVGKDTSTGLRAGTRRKLPK